jgi:uncharacterized 2Fe-2S/4Fe-4S cluster protein (DUF4445 family)
MDVDVILHQGKNRVEVRVPAGSTARDAVLAASLSLESPCGGKGLCGKCRVTIAGRDLSPPAGQELEFLSQAEIAAGERLACMTRLGGGAEIRVPEAKQASIIMEASTQKIEVDPPVRRLIVHTKPPSLEDQADDETRLLRALAPLFPGRALSVSQAALAGLARSSRDGLPISVLLSGGEVIDARPERPGERALGVGIDIGTTTVVCYLVDLESGEQLGARSALNAQRVFGADVISRIAASSESPAGLESLRGAIAGQLSQLIALAALDAGLALEDIVSIVVAGNTTMLHLLAGVPPDAIARSPFAPAFLGRRETSAAELGLVAHRTCTAILLPGVSGYVGADIVSGMAAVHMAETQGPALFLDLGTNGEIALGGSEGILCCATAAGPAFEGAGIEMGMAGVDGAIDSVWIEDGAIRCTTIGGKSATGICGSGLVDAIAAFLDCGLVDDTGRVMDAEEAAALPPAIAAAREGEDRDVRIYVDRAAGVYLSQGDIRAAQLAKAAVAAGIASLAASAGIKMDEISRLWLAGGFGSFIDLRSAVRIGLFPCALRDRVIVAGNTAGAGAVAACLSSARLAECDRLRSLCSYIELSSRADFNDYFVENMMFPENC